MPAPEGGVGLPEVFVAVSVTDAAQLRAVRRDQDGQKVVGDGFHIHVVQCQCLDWLSVRSMASYSAAFCDSRIDVQCNWVYLFINT